MHRRTPPRRGGPRAPGHTTPTPTAADEPQAHTPAVVDIPVGQPADRALQMEITSVVRELYACFNAGDSLRAFALASDDFLKNFVAEGSLTTQDIDFLLSEPVPVPVEDRTTILAITDMSRFETGRAGAFVITFDRFNGADTVYMTLVHQGNRWLVNEIVDFL